ncbi:SsrA-binding protein SmpB [Acidocella aminolytica]|uniref:SsrA-binding protein n=1 Tax=Acidocella aminolytica 101 = DSM 11237 TaxID=1120923 RepID=A0A0D6PLY9_9PROT|nr:SsrA-binding protein SmpB [Acidocella aminolytica]GAN81794.1 trans-translation helper factor SmpB/ssrA-binding protein [Acidocella aminolytica 101 = DSM 11237]GBQ35127.1 SsrA-binding protein [Acidocella aminolytica 101 = DSM 11237]SHE80977.1 SsrA-binding protein [Acidocella aminolytica 101 = DSM 11237]
MSKDKKKSEFISHGIAAQNRKARHDYTILSTIEAGIVLRGVEVKSLRLGRAQLNEAWAGERDGELFLFNLYIPEYQSGVLSRFDVRGLRKLLIKRKERNQIFAAISRDRRTVVPLDVFFNDRGLAKVTLGIAEGKQKADKRHAAAERDWKRDKARLLRNK